ncbi:MAG TPA: hypothetical protein VES42_01500 [Pilimelia sp.]|nr:hypothetical protein [Pilimelia sp.]
MTTPTPPGGTQLRTFAVWALLAYAALLIVFAFLRWLLPDGNTFGGRSAAADFTTVPTMAAPLLAVLLAAAVSPPLRNARLAALIALAEYAAVLVFGTLALLIGLPAVFDSLGGNYPGVASTNALAFLLVGIVELALVAIAAAWVWRVLAGLGGGLRRARRTG